MKFKEIQEACWTGYRQAGMKKKGDRQVPNCVPVEEVKIGPEITGKDLLFKAAAMAMRDASHEGVSLDYEQAIRQASKIYGIPYTPSELPRLLAQRAEIDRLLALLKQGKQVAKARRQEKRAPTPAGAEEYWRTHALPTDRIKPPAKTLEETEAELAEDLKKWFKEKWVRFGPDGKIRGACARGSSKEGKPKCLPQSKAHALGKKGRASAAAKKRREDPNPERRGPAKNVATKVREVKDINAVRDLIKQSGASNAFQQADDKRQQAEALLDQLKDLQNKRQQLAIKRIKPSQEYYQELDRIVTAIGDLGYEAEGPTNGQYTLRAKFKEQHDWDDADEFGMPGSEFFQDDDRLRDGDYVRDRQDGEYGEIFRMSGDPTERRVRILDRDGRGWYISPERLVAVDRNDPDIMKYFGKRRQRNMDEQIDSAGGRMYQAKEKFLLSRDGKQIAFYDNMIQAQKDAERMQKELGGEVIVQRVMREQTLGGAKTYYRVIFNGRPLDMLFATMQQAQMVATKLEQKYGGKARVDHTVDVPKDLQEKQDACYRKVKSRYKVWPSAYASGALVQCRKKGAANWGTGGKKK